MITKPANWHMNRDDMTIGELVVQECLHSIDGAYPMTLACEWLGGDILLEIVRAGEQVLAIYYMSEKTADLWSEKLGFTFVENGWSVIESSKSQNPYIVGKVVPREFPEDLASAVEESFNWLNPEIVKTGNFSLEGYLCPQDYGPAEEGI